jgi:hypothetical protein
MPELRQRKLSADAITEFHHHDFVADQVRDFLALQDSTCVGTIVDMGGGCGFFAQRLAGNVRNRIRVVDMDIASVRACHDAGVEAEVGDALEPTYAGDESVACFNLILHHLVAGEETTTRSLQEKALTAWHRKASAVFVNEYIYQSFLRNASGQLIYQITKSKLLSSIGRVIAKVIPAFNANTFGVGVRFRSHDEWRALFVEAGFEICGVRIGHSERIAAPLRLLLIKEIRRDSFWLVPKSADSAHKMNNKEE